MLKLKLFFHKILNSHDGYCSGDDCEESDAGTKEYEVILRKGDYWPEARSQLEGLLVGDIFTEGPVFDHLQEEHEDSESEGDGGSGYCGNGSERFRKHTLNTVLVGVEVKEILPAVYSL